MVNAEELRTPFGVIVTSCDDPVAEIQQSRAVTYRRVTINLAVARTDTEIPVQGVFLAVEKNEGDVTIKLNRKEQPNLSLSTYPVIRSPFDRFFITNTAQPGRELIVLVSSEGEFEVSAPSSNLQIASNYSRLNFDLGSLRTDADISATLRLSETQQALGFTVIILTGVATVKLNSASADAIQLSAGLVLDNFRYSKIFLTNTAQAGLDLDLFVPIG